MCDTPCTATCETASEAASGWRAKWRPAVALPLVVVLLALSRPPYNGLSVPCPTTANGGVAHFALTG